VPGVSGYQIVEIQPFVPTTGAGATALFDARCPPGKRPLGAGYTFGTSIANFKANAFVIDVPLPPDAWRFAVNNLGAPFTLFASVVCATVN
jgi:hypothetical protein